jgi:antitoxin (DNA-binding transcriptional repressor) of toxin-antitoxin stability system
MEKVTLSFLEKNLASVFDKVKKGKSLLVTDNGRTVARIIPEQETEDSERILANIVTSKEEFEARMAELDKAYAEGRLSVNDSYLANVEPVDMGPTDSSNLDAEIYK